MAWIDSTTGNIGSRTWDRTAITGDKLLILANRTGSSPYSNAETGIETTARDENLTFPSNNATRDRKNALAFSSFLNKKK